MKITKSKAKLWSKLGSRAVFGMALTELADEYQNFYAMSGKKNIQIASLTWELPNKI